MTHPDQKSVARQDTTGSPMIPELTTRRLRLRAPGPADFPALTAFFASDRAKFVGGPMTAERAWRQLATEIGHWTLLGYGRWAVEERTTGAFAGIVGLWNPEGWPEPEIGWDLMDGFEGKGYATEAALAARDFAYGTLGWTTAISLVAPENVASAAVARRLGAVAEADLPDFAFGPVQIWRHPSPEVLS